MAGEYSSDSIITAKIHNKTNVTKEEIVEEAIKVWEKRKKEVFDITDQTSADEFMSKMRKEHKDFCMSYPIVLRYISQFKSFNKIAFKKYLDKIEKRPWTGESEYLDSQADYAVILYKQTHPKWNTTEVNNIRRNIRMLLEKESKMFKDNLDKFDKEVTSREELFKKELLNDIIKDLDGARSRVLSGEKPVDVVLFDECF
jgi:hypothetical protein